MWEFIMAFVSQREWLETDMLSHFNAVVNQCTQKCIELANGLIFTYATKFTLKVDQTR
jgi:hypothetical protein